VASPEPQTTTATWDSFERYNVATRGRNDVPPRFLKNAVWRDHQGRLGYYAESNLSPRAIVPVEFNKPHLCWVELHWRAHEDQWQVFRKTPEDLGLEIPITELTAQEVIQILGPESPEPSEHNYRDERPEQTPETTPLRDSSMSEALEPIQVYTEEMQDEREMRDQAESLHIFDQGVQDFMTAPRITTTRIGDTLHAFATRTEESRTQTAHIDPNTGHVIDPDEAAAHRAAGPDRADPPEGDGGGGGGYPFGPGGGGGGGGGGNGGGGGPPGAGGGHHNQDKLFGQHPDTFTGDRSKTREFLTQWELYYNLNYANAIMGVPYSRSMLFLTHLKGPLTATWAASMSRDLTNRIRTGVRPEDERLWTHMFQSFRRQYADNQEQEQAENLLQRGIRMQGEDLDTYIAKYEGLVLEAGFNLRDRLCLKMFTNGLPHDLYHDIL
jgi:hypothetical protein